MAALRPGPLPTFDGDAVINSSKSSPLPSSAHPHLLRVLIVDDNPLNLTVLGKLLRKKFSHFLDSPPVAVDSALKALQLLQNNVYDLILMDIQMPFLSGVDCTQRIRQGYDGVLEANRQATVIAVTTAVGEEPEALYRRAGFDGLIGKPMKSEAMQELLEPLLAAAQEAAKKVIPFLVKGQLVTPPLPVVPISGPRCFFLPLPTDTDATTSHAPFITRTNNFEALLKEQTRMSLFQYGACAIARTNSSHGISDRRRLREYGDESSSSSSLSSADEVSQRSAVSEANVAPSQVMKPAVELSSSRSQNTKWAHCGRSASLTISQSSLNEQLFREMQAAYMHVPTRQSCSHISINTSLSAPATIIHSLSSDGRSSLKQCEDDSQTEVEKDIAPDEPLSPFSHFGNSDDGDASEAISQYRRQQQTLSKVRPRLTASFGSRWPGPSLGSTRRSSSMCHSSSSAESESPGSAPSSSRSGSIATERDAEDDRLTPLTTPDNDNRPFLLEPVGKTKAIVSIDSLPSPLSCSVEEVNLHSPENDTLSKERSPWRPPLERNVSIQEIPTIAKVLQDQFKNFRM